MSLTLDRLSRCVALAAALATALGCSSSAPTPESPTAPESAEPAAPPHESDLAAAEASEPEPEPEPELVELVIPTECSDPDAEVCMPPKKFVEQLCRQGSVGLAFAMFQKDMPWTRAYLRVSTDAWYADGRRSAPSEVERGEEVLIIANRTGPADGPRVVGAGSYDVFRWDGSCVSVMEDEVTTRRPPVPKIAPIRWRDIEDPIRAKLLEDKQIDYRNEMRRKFCKSGNGESKACKNMKVALMRLIADYVRKGGELPEPDLVVR